MLAGSGIREQRAQITSGFFEQLDEALIGLGILRGDLGDLFFAARRVIPQDQSSAVVERSEELGVFGTDIELETKFADKLGQQQRQRVGRGRDPETGE